MLLTSKAIHAKQTLRVCRESLRGAELLRSIPLQKFSLSSYVLTFQLNQLRHRESRCSSHDNSSKVIHILYRGYNHYVSSIDLVFELNNSDQSRHWKYRWPTLLLQYTLYNVRTTMLYSMPHISLPYYIYTHTHTHTHTHVPIQDHDHQLFACIFLLDLFTYFNTQHEVD